MNTIAAPRIPTPVPGAFYQRNAPGDPVRLEVMAREPGPEEGHFYVSGVVFADLAPILAPALSSAQAVIFKMPPGLLNPNYWEPHTKAGEEAVRARSSGIITRDDGGASWLWRSDAIAPGRHLRDGLEVHVEMLAGYAFRVRGPDVLKLGDAWAASGGDAKDRFEWIAFRPVPGQVGWSGPPIDAQDDLVSFRLQTPGEAVMFAATGDRRVRMAFADRSPLRACARAALRGYMIRCAGRVVSPPNDDVCDQFLDQARRGLTSEPGRDFVSRNTAFEFTAWPGRTPWSGKTEPSEERALVYYDRVSGIWAVAS
jgi:hypothetical protein